MEAPTQPSVGRAKAPGTVPTMPKPNRLWRSTAAQFDDGVELHSGVALVPGPAEREPAQRGAGASPPGIGSDHEAGGRHMRARSGAVPPHLGGAEDTIAADGDDRQPRRRLDPAY
jgi:hypothetical protein